MRRRIRFPFLTPPFTAARAESSPTSEGTRRHHPKCPRARDRRRPHAPPLGTALGLRRPWCGALFATLLAGSASPPPWPQRVPRSHPPRIRAGAPIRRRPNRYLPRLASRSRFQAPPLIFKCHWIIRDEVHYAFSHCIAIGNEGSRTKEMRQFGANQFLALIRLREAYLKIDEVS